MRRLCFALTWLAVIMTVDAQSSGDLVHTVDAGETLISIANAYGVSLEQLLTLNGLDPDAILPIGRQLIVVPAGDLVAAEEQTDEQVPTEEATEAAISTTSLNGLPPAPIIAADAPVVDPAAINGQLCFSVFADDNQNGMREPSEVYLHGATILLLDEADNEVLQYTTDGQSEPHCPDNLPSQTFEVTAHAPAGFGLTGAASLRLDLRKGGDVEVAFGAKHGLEVVVGPPLQPVAQDEAPADAGEPSILRELSGLFVLMLAGVVLCSGMVVSVFLRGR